MTSSTDRIDYLIDYYDLRDQVLACIAGLGLNVGDDDEHAAPIRRALVIAYNRGHGSAVRDAQVDR